MLKIDPSKCSNCRVCQVVCSNQNFRVNNPKKGRIKVTPKFPKPEYEIIVCNQCGECARVCPENAIYEKKKIFIIDEKKCTNCGACVDICPIDAMFVHKELKTPLKCILCGMCAKYCPTGAIVRG